MNILDLARNSNFEKVYYAKRAKEAEAFINEKFVPRNELDKVVYEIMRKYAEITLANFNSVNNPVNDVVLDKVFEDLLTKNKVPLDTTATADYMDDNSGWFCRDYLTLKMLEYTSEAVYELSNELRNYSEGNIPF